MPDQFDKELQKINQNNGFNDLWNSKYFYDRCKDDIKYCKRKGGWFIWDKSRWIYDHNNRIQAMGIDTIRDFKTYSSVLDDKKLIKAFDTHMLRSGSYQHIRRMISLLSSHDKIICSPNDFDSHPMLLNCENGTIDLTSGDLVQHNRADLITKIAPVQYDPDAKCPLWEQFLNDIFVDNKELIAFMQRVCGYVLTDSTEEHAFFILHGDGRNGKSTFLKILDALLGDYSKSAPASTLAPKRDGAIPNDLASLVGARAVSCIETKKGKSLDEAMIKQVTGEDTVSARFLGKEFFEFTPTFKIFFATNHKPDVYGTDEGIWERIKMIPFNFKVDAAKKDMVLKQKLIKELPGILNWAIEGCLSWQKNGLNSPIDVIVATDEYRSDEDIIGEFITENIEMTGNENHELRCDDLILEFREWCESTGQEYEGKFIRKKDFKEYLKAKNVPFLKVTSGINRFKRCFVGVKLNFSNINKDQKWDNYDK